MHDVPPSFRTIGDTGRPVPDPAPASYSRRAPEPAPAAFATLGEAAGSGHGGFAFERPTARVDWRRIARTNVLSLQRGGDTSTLRGFLGDVALGDADDGRQAAAPAHAKALRSLQLSSQYLLYCQQTLKVRAAAPLSSRRVSRLSLVRTDASGKTTTRHS